MRLVVAELGKRGGADGICAVENRGGVVTFARRGVHERGDIGVAECEQRRAFFGRQQIDAEPAGRVHERKRSVSRDELREPLREFAEAGAEKIKQRGGDEGKIDEIAIPGLIANLSRPEIATRCLSREQYMEDGS